MPLNDMTLIACIESDLQYLQPNSSHYDYLWKATVAGNPNSRHSAGFFNGFAFGQNSCQPLFSVTERHGRRDPVSVASGLRTNAHCIPREDLRVT